jgi:hypothetical protein
MVGLAGAALLLSLDSVVVSFALGACRIGGQRKWLAAAFGLCDGTASLVGLFLGISIAGKIAVVGEWGGPALVGAYAVILLVCARLGRGMADSRSRLVIPWLYLLPLVMSLDNLTASFALVQGESPVVCAAVMGLVSGIGSLCAFQAGEWASTALERFGRTLGIRGKVQYLEGLILVSAALLLAIC